MDVCVFCKIIAGKIPTEFVHVDDDTVVFADIKPSAPVHVLIVPKKHIYDLTQAGDEASLVGKLQLVAAEVSKKLGIANSYKIVINGGSLQEVPHMHYHLLGGWSKGGEK